MQNLVDFMRTWPPAGSRFLKWSCLLVAVAAAGCATPVLDRLSGEPETTAVWTQPITKRTHPAVAGCQRFVLAVQRGAVDDAWSQLSQETRQALSSRAALIGLRGPDLLRLRKLPIPPVAEAKDPADDLAKTTPAPADVATPTVALDPLRLFVVADVKTLQVLATPESDRYVEQLVELTDVSGSKRTVALRFESYGWRLHHPTLAYP